MSRFVHDFCQYGITTFPFYQGYDGLLVAFANQCVTFPMPDLSTLFNMGWTVGNGSATDDLSSSLSAASIALSPLFLTAKMLVEQAASRFISIDMAVNRLVADRHFSTDLFRAPLALQITHDQKPVRRIHLAGVAAVGRPLLC